jgi:hypothetical protein
MDITTVIAIAVIVTTEWWEGSRDVAGSPECVE